MKILTYPYIYTFHTWGLIKRAPVDMDMLFLSISAGTIDFLRHRGLIVVLRRCRHSISRASSTRAPIDMDVFLLPIPAGSTNRLHHSGPLAIGAGCKQRGEEDIMVRTLNISK